MLFLKVGEGLLCLATSTLGSKLNSGAVGVLHLVASPLSLKLNSGAVGMLPLLCLAASLLSSKLNSGAVGMMHLAASPLSSKLNSGAVGVLQGVCMTPPILIRLFGQSNVETKGSLWTPLSKVGEGNGGLLYSPSISFSCFFVSSKIASRCAFCFHS